MPKFTCGSCDSKIKVPDEYIGKRVKCPGCGKAVVVPGEVDDGSKLDLSLLDDSMSPAASSAKPRKLRSIVIGCGVCSKIIHIPENRKGAVSPCPKCKTPLLVDVPELPDTSGSTIDFKHLVLDPASEPSLSGDSLAGGASASMTSTGTGIGRSGRSRKGGTMGGSRLSNTGSFGAAGSMSGSMSGGSTGNAQDQMAELRSLNDLKASGAIDDEEYRRRKAAVYSGGGDSSMARKATSRSAAGASERAIRVESGASIPTPLKALIVVAVLAFGGFAVYEFGIKPALRDIDDATTFDSDRETDEDRRTAAQREADAEAERLAREQAEAEERANAEPVVTWASLIPDLGPDAVEVAFVAPGQVGPAPDVSLFAAADELDGGSSDFFGDNDGFGAAGGGATARSDRQDRNDRRSSPPPKPGTIVMWDIFYPEARDRHPLSRLSTFSRQMQSGQSTATIGVGIGPAVNGLDDLDFVRWENVEVRQALINGMAGLMNVPTGGPEINERVDTIGDFTYREMAFNGIREDRGKRAVLLTGIQNGYAVHYWFAGEARLYRAWKAEAVGKAMIQ